MITAIGLQNFKGFEAETVPCAQVTLLAGQNGMGKSTVLQSLLLLRQSYLQGLLRSRGLALNGDLVHLGTGKDVFREQAKGDLLRFDLYLTDDIAGSWEFQYEKATDVMRLFNADVTDAIYDTPLFSRAFHYLNAERCGPRSVSEMSDYAVNELRALGTQGEFAGHFLSQFRTEAISSSILAHEKAETMRLGDQVNAWMSEISPGTRIDFDLYPGSSLLTVNWSFDLGREFSNLYHGANVGFGLTYALPVVLALVGSRPGDLILIENPEAHLHPRGQRRIGELICKAAHAGMQVLVETHSDHVLNGIRLAVRSGEIEAAAVNLHFFYRSNASDSPGRIVFDSPIIDADGRLDYWPVGFFDEWDNALEDLLRPKGS